MIVELGQIQPRRPTTRRRGVIQPPGEMPPVTTIAFLDYLDIAQGIGERFYILNAMQARPLSIARYVSLSRIAKHWGTREAMESRVRAYRRWISLRGGTFADEDYAGRVFWAYRRAFPEAAPEDVMTAMELCLQLLNWTRLNYPRTPQEFTCDVMLTMLGAFDITEEDVFIPTLPITTPTTPPEEREEEEKDNKVIIAIIAVIALALIWR